MGKVIIENGNYYNEPGGTTTGVGGVDASGNVYNYSAWGLYVNLDADRTS